MIDFGLSCLELAASSELLLAKRGFFWADLCPILNCLLEYTNVQRHMIKSRSSNRAFLLWSLFCSFRRGGFGDPLDTLPEHDERSIESVCGRTTSRSFGSAPSYKCYRPFPLPRATSEYIISSVPPRFSSTTAITSETPTRCEPESSRRYASES